MQDLQSQQQQQQQEALIQITTIVELLLIEVKV
jgi:hypothetical protein